MAALRVGASRSRRALLVVFRHVLRFRVRDSLVAIDAGVLVFLTDLVHLGSACLLLFDVHRRERVTVAAFARIARLHSVPLVGRQFEPLRLELLGGRNGAHDLAVELLAGGDLAHHLVPPVLRHVAVGAVGADAGAVAVVNGLLVLLVHVVLHLVTADAELECVGGFHRRVEAAPEEDAGNEADRQQRKQRVLGTGAFEAGPEP